MVEKFPTVLEKLPHVLRGGDFFDSHCRYFAPIFYCFHRSVLLIIQCRMMGIILRCVDHVFLEFVDHPKMKPIKDRTVWIHINIPGQGSGAADLPSE